MRLRLLLLTLLAFTACNDLTGPTVSLNERFTLAPGETAQLKTLRTFITVIGVEGDSRCPADAFCIQGGDARVQIDVQSNGPKRRHELHTGDLRPVVHGDLTITMTDLQPYPFSARIIKPEDYRVTLTVTR